jgi:hypothetical protein
MKTDDLIEMLARQAGPAPRYLLLRTLGPALCMGALVSLALVFALKSPVPASFWLTSAPWVKLIYGLALAAAGLWWMTGAARPAAPQALARQVAFLVLVAMAVTGLGAWALAPAPERMSSLLGSDPLGCVRNVALAALPVAALLLWAMRRLAPTQLRAAGAAAGLAAGATGSVIYSLSCTETGLPFVAVWYTAGVLLVAGLGAWVAPRLLRW